MNKLKYWLLGSLVVGLSVGGCGEKLNDLTTEIPNPYTSVANQVTFVDLPATCTITVYTLEGARVRAIQESDGDGVAYWDTKNETGGTVESGTYQFVISSLTGQKKGKVVIIR
jgi:flagellar hook assembly protein FlgD